MRVFGMGDIQAQNDPCTECICELSAPFIITMVRAMPQSLRICPCDASGDCSDPSSHSTAVTLVPGEGARDTHRPPWEKSSLQRLSANMERVHANTTTNQP